MKWEISCSSEEWDCLSCFISTVTVIILCATCIISLYSINSIQNKKMSVHGCRVQLLWESELI